MHIVVRDRTCILTFKDRYLEDETDTFVQITVHNRVYICVVFVQITVSMHEKGLIFQICVSCELFNYGPHVYQQFFCINRRQIGTIF